MIPLLRRAVAARGAPYDVKRVALWWNAGLSAFSCVGLASCAPVLLGVTSAFMLVGAAASLALPEPRGRVIG